MKSRTCSFQSYNFTAGPVNFLLLQNSAIDSPNVFLLIDTNVFPSILRFSEYDKNDCLLLITFLKGQNPLANRSVKKRMLKKALLVITC